MKKLLIALLALTGISAFSAPQNYKLVAAKKITLVDRETVLVTYMAPCKSTDWVTVVMGYHDSDDGDSMAVGVAYPEQYCDKIDHLKEHTTHGTLEKDFRGKEDLYFEPMTIAK